MQNYRLAPRGEEEECWNLMAYQAFPEGCCLSVCLCWLIEKSHVAFSCRKGKVFAYKNEKFFRIMVGVSHWGNNMLFLGKSLCKRFWKKKSWFSPYLSGLVLFQEWGLFYLSFLSFPIYCRDMIRVWNLSPPISSLINAKSYYRKGEWETKFWYGLFHE